MSFFLAIIALFAIGSAFALPTTDPPCASDQQYVPDASSPTGFKPVTVGVDGNCLSSSNTCTYYESAPGVFTQCLLGDWQPRH